MKAFFVVLIIFFIACKQSNERLENSPATNSQANQTVTSDKNESYAPPVFDESIYKDYIPQRLAAFLAEEMPDRKIPAPDKWGYTFNEFKTSNNLVNFVSSDFNCDKRTDYALILEDGQKALSIWVFFAKKNGFEKIKLEDVGGGWEHIDFGLSVAQAGMLDVWDDKPIKINCPAIEVISFEKAADAYYWDNGKFKSVITSD